MHVETARTCQNCGTWNAMRCGFDSGCDEWTPDCVHWYDAEKIPPPEGDIIGLSKSGEMMLGEYFKGTFICTGYTMEHVVCWARPLPRPGQDE